MDSCESDPVPGVDLPAGGQPCCEPSSDAACDDPDIVACVCGRDTYCCERDWDPACISQADEFCGAECS
ncbi:hypothetical protein [Nannocystis pusilla]|uniref:Uncharacterized protein n=1 Tax=Nannocystis pusilla TaxID=889268 RepID=A0ABS7TLP3_9BACT|nr:hypothetical protein [Nannocystis pusilla]MBZ5709148.1 hypothetical protein [Nannocystis pusilla]